MASVDANTSVINLFLIGLYSNAQYFVAILGTSCSVKKCTDIFSIYSLFRLVINYFAEICLHTFNKLEASVNIVVHSVLIVTFTQNIVTDQIQYT